MIVTDKSPRLYKKWFNWLLIVGVFMILAISWRGGEIAPLKLIEDSGNMWVMAKEFFPPDFTHWRLYLEEILVTLYIAIWGTLLGIIFAIPLGLLSASNIAPVWVQQIVRRLMDALRSINEMVFAMIFVAAVGLGPFPGILALFLHTTGSLAKLFAEAVEAIDEGPVEGLGPPVLVSFKRLFMVLFLKSCRFGSRMHSIDLSLIFALPQLWEWWVLEGSEYCCGRVFAVLVFRKRQPLSSLLL